MTPTGPPWPTRGDPRATSDPPIAATPWPRRRPPAPRINRKTDETYHRVRAELKAQGAGPPRSRPDPLEPDASPARVSHDGARRRAELLAINRAFAARAARPRRRVVPR